jgi:hypothetical protein
MQGMRQNSMLAAVRLTSVAIAFPGCGSGSKASPPPPAGPQPGSELVVTGPCYSRRKWFHADCERIELCLLHNRALEWAISS